MATFSSTAPFCRIPSGPFTWNGGAHPKSTPNSSSTQNLACHLKISTEKCCQELKHTHYITNICFISSCFPGLFKLQLISWEKLTGGDCFPADYIFPHNPTINTCSITSRFTGLFKLQLISREKKEIAFLQLHFSTVLHNKIPFQQFQQLFSHPSFYSRDLPGNRIFIAQDFPHLFLFCIHHGLPKPWNSATFGAVSATFPHPAFLLLKITPFFGTFTTRRCGCHAGILAWPLQVLPLGLPRCPGLISPALRGFSTSKLCWERPQNLVLTLCSLPSLAKIPPKAEEG